mgnify:CR=1 FL=1
MKDLNPNALVFWAFLSVGSQLIFGNFLYGLFLGLAVSTIAGLVT